MNFAPDTQAKKLYIIYIMKILQDDTDYDHRLRQQDIIDIMESRYGITLERKAVARNIELLRDYCDMDIQSDGGQGYYLASREFDDSELRLLIDSVLASKHIPKAQAKSLTEKLAGLSSKFFKKQVRYISNIDFLDHDKSNELFLTIELLSEAIESKKKIRFYYTKYGIDKKLHNTTSEKHLVNPYQIIVANGRYYLVGNIDKYSNSTHFRVERIRDIEILEDTVKTITEVDEFKQGFDLPKHMLEHMYMFSGSSVWVKFRIKNNRISDAIDWLGHEIDVVPEDENFSLVRVKVNPSAMNYWALQFGEAVEIIEPASLRKEVGTTIREIAQKYED